jgi:23S rRNA pseudouridine2605 synthase/16S rRNA pseudouridine516 synthase
MSKGRTPKWLLAAQARKTAPPQEGADWLLRALGRAGAMPHEEAEAALRDGRVKLDGRVSREPFSPVTSTSKVSVDGQPIDLRPTTRVVMFHKPRGLITHGRDPEGIGTVFEGLARALTRLDPALARYAWHAVGRLDRDTTGLLLFTNDERFVAHATRPETHLAKRYRAAVGADVTDKKLDPLRRGMKLDGGEVAQPAKAKVRGPREVELTLTEGKYHQVKRMLGAVGLPVLSLHRESVGALELELPEGEARLLGDDEVTRALQYVPRHRS